MYPRPRCFKALKNQIKPKLKSSKLNYWNPVAQRTSINHIRIRKNPVGILEGANRNLITNLRNPMDS